MVVSNDQGQLVSFVLIDEEQWDLCLELLHFRLSNILVLIRFEGLIVPRLRVGVVNGVLIRSQWIAVSFLCTTVFRIHQEDVGVEVAVELLNIYICVNNPKIIGYA